MADDQASVTMSHEDMVGDLPDVVKDTPIGMPRAIAAAAMNMALKYCDTIVIKDGVMYQQKKMEGSNIQPLELDYVFYVAKRIEEHLMSAESRFAKLVVASVIDMLDDDTEPTTTEEGKDDTNG